MLCPALFCLSPMGGGYGDHLFPGINPLEGSIKLFCFFPLCDCFFSSIPGLSRLTLFLPVPPASWRVKLRLC